MQYFNLFAAWKWYHAYSTQNLHSYWISYDFIHFSNITTDIMAQGLLRCPHVKAGLSLDELLRIYKGKPVEVAMCTFYIRYLYSITLCI